MRSRRPAPRDRRSIGKFVGGFVALFALFQLVYYGLLVDSSPFDAYVGVSNRLAAAALTLGGEPAKASGDILSGGFSISVRKGCDGIQAMGLLAITIALLPGSPVRKGLGILAGVLGLALLNTLRLASLVWTGKHHPDYFQPLHVHFWPAVLVAFAVVYALVWMKWAERRTSESV